MRGRRMVAGVAVAALALSGLALAQGRMRPGGGGEGTGGFGQMGDPAQMRQMMMENLRLQLQVGEQDWQVLGPRIERAMALSREAESYRWRMSRGGFGGGMGGGPMGAVPGGPGLGDEGAGRAGRGRAGGGPGGPRGGWGGDEVSAVGLAADALQDALDDPKATSQQIRAKLTALRAARDKVRKQLAEVRQQIRKQVTQRQEAQLVLMGVLD